jgi:hypothetical protein
MIFVFLSQGSDSTMCPGHVPADFVDFATTSPTVESSINTPTNPSFLFPLFPLLFLLWPKP